MRRILLAVLHLGAPAVVGAELVEVRPEELLRAEVAGQRPAVALRCPVPLLIGTATHEGGISEAEIEQLRRSLCSFAVEPVPDAGHFVFEERPLAVVAAVEKTAGAAALVARGLR